MTDRIDIIHVSDLHYSNEKAYDIEVVLRALKSDLEELCARNIRPSLIAFTGDVTQSAKVDEYAGAFDLLIKHIIDPFNLYDRMLLVPGNHDADRQAVEIDQERYTKIDASISDRASVESLFSSSDFTDHLTKKFMNFFAFQNTIDRLQRLFMSPLVDAVTIKGTGLGVVLVNTAAMTTTGIVRKDSGLLLLSEQMLDAALEKVKAAGLTPMVLCHHPLRDLHEVCRDDIESLLERHNAILIHGHMHRQKTASAYTSSGRIVSSQNAALFTKREYWNGYSILSVIPGIEHTMLEFRTYSDKQRRFVAGTDVISGAKFFTSLEAEKFWKSHPSQIDQKTLREWIKGSMHPSLEKEFCEATYDKSLTDVFVPPTLSKLLDIRKAEPTEVSQNSIDIPSILNGSDNIFLCSGREFGKTSLLKYLAMEMSRQSEAEYCRVPVHINYTDIKPAHNGVVRAIRMTLPADLPENITLDMLLRCGQITLLIDDVNPEDTKRYGLIKQFMEEYKKVRFLFCLDTSFQPIVIGFSPDLPLEFEKVFIQAFSRSQLRTLVTKWSGKQHDDVDQLLDRVVDHISNINVPITAVTGSIILTILGRQPDFTPINRSAVIRQFIEVLLGKHLPADILSESFDSTNKSHFLSALAKFMVLRDEYALPVADVQKFASDYVDLYGLPQSPPVLIDAFVQARILAHRDGTIAFKYRSFAEYFIALQMSNDQEFRDHVLHEDRYLSFIQEIEYYAGFTRDDLGLLNKIRNRLDELGRRTSLSDNWQSKLKIYETLNVEKTSSLEILAGAQMELEEPAPSDDDRDNELEATGPRDIGDRQEIKRQTIEHDGHRFLSCIILFSRILRATELVAKPEKRSNLYSALRHWGTYSVYLFEISQLLAKKRKATINGVLYTVGFGEKLTDEELQAKLYYAIPGSINDNIRENLATDKLSPIFESALIDAPELEPVIIEFMRHALMLDIRSMGYEKRIQKLIENLPKADLLKHVLLARLQFIYRTGTGTHRDKVFPIIQKLLGQIDVEGKRLGPKQITANIERLKKDRLFMEIRGLEDHNGAR